MKTRTLISFVLALVLGCIAQGQMTRPAPSTLGTLLAKIADPVLRQQLASAITASGGNLDYVVANVIPSGTDLAKYPFVAGQDYVGAPGASYTLTPTFPLMLNDVSIDLKGCPLSIPPVPGAGTGIELRGNGISFVGAVVTAAPSAMTVVRCIGTDANVDVTINVPVGIAIKVDPPADRANCRFVLSNPTGGQNAYVVGAVGVVFHDSVSAGSLGEGDIRYSADNAPPVGTGKIPRYGRVLNCALGATKQVGDKQSGAVEFRNMGDGAATDWCEVSGCILSMWTRMGQTTNKPTVWNLKFNNNHCLLEPHGFDQLDLIAATMQQCDGNTFDYDSNQRPIGWTVNISQAGVPTNNRMQPVVAGAKRKKLMIGNNGSGEADGGNLIVLPFVPQTQPATKPVTTRRGFPIRDQRSFDIASGHT